MKNIVVSAQVSRIGSKAFMKCSATRLTLQTKKLTAKFRVRNCLKQSNMKLVSVRVAGSDTNKSFRKKYQKVFKKSIVGKKAKVK